MILNCYNMEPDGRMLIDLQTATHRHQIIIPVDWIDELADGINKHCGSEGDGEGFSLIVPSKPLSHRKDKDA